MRSRYSAYVLNNGEYLLRTWASNTRPAAIEFDDQLTWYGLQIVDTDQASDHGYVHFKARFCVINNEGAHTHTDWQELEETSRFVLQDQQWIYVDGDAQWRKLSIGRNDACPCGSSKKWKRCCG